MTVITAACPHRSSPIHALNMIQTHIAAYELIEVRVYEVSAPFIARTRCQKAQWKQSSKGPEFSLHKHLIIGIVHVPYVVGQNDRSVKLQIYMRIPCTKPFVMTQYRFRCSRIPMSCEARARAAKLLPDGTINQLLTLRIGIDLSFVNLLLVHFMSRLKV